MPLAANAVLTSSMLVLLPLSVVGISIGVMYFALNLVKRSAQRENRRHPLKLPLLRPAGYSVGMKADEAMVELMMYLLMSMLMPALIGMGFLLNVVLGVTPATVFSTGVATFLAFFSMAWPLKMAIATLKTRRDYRLGWEGELATAEALAPLTASGYRVFHDVPDNGFNIDHVVVGPSGVYAIETKARIKHGTEKDSHRIVFDGKSLKFPGFSTDKPLLQAERQAKSLGGWLGQAVGISMTPIPVVVIPGWYIDRTGKGKVFVMASANVSKYLPTIKAGEPLDNSQIERIAYQLDLKCRDVALKENLI